MRLATSRRGDGPLLVCHPGGPGFDGSELRDLGGLDTTRTLLLIDPRWTRSQEGSQAAALVNGTGCVLNVPTSKRARRCESW